MLPSLPRRRHDRHLELRGAVAGAVLSTAPIVLCDGPAGTGKTLGLLAGAGVARCEQFPGFRCLLLRHTRASLADSVLPTLEEEVFPSDHPAIARPVDRSSRRRYRFSNGSMMVVAGLDQPEKTYSAQYDLVLLFEAVVGVTQITLSKLIRLLRNKHMLHPDGPDPETGEPRYLHQIIMDTNPAEPSHWLKTMAEAGKIARFKSRHEDNPALWDAENQRWTPHGRDYIAKLDAIPDEFVRLRMRHGEWVAAEGGVFSARVLSEHRAEHGREPDLIGKLVIGPGRRGLEGFERDLALAKRRVDLIRFVPLPAEHPEARWKFWCDLVPDKHGNPRPPQETVYCAASDPSWGQGAANAVISVGDRALRAKVAEFACANTPPEELARLLVMAGLWFGGQRRYAFLAWEANGPGNGLVKIVLGKLGYPWIYKHRIIGSVNDRQTDRVGWWSERQTKIDLAIGLREAYEARTFLNPSEPAIDEAMGWIRYERGGIGPASMQHESLDAQATHGDRVVADMLLVHGFEQCMLMAPPRAKPPVGSVARELEEEDEEARSRDGLPMLR